MRIFVIANYLSSAGASTKTNVSVTFSSVKLKPAREQYGKCEERRRSLDRSDKIGKNKKEDRVRQKKRELSSFIKKKIITSGGERDSRKVNDTSCYSYFSASPRSPTPLPLVLEQRLPPPFCPAPSLQPWKISRDKPRFSLSSFCKSFLSLSLSFSSSRVVGALIENPAKLWPRL